MATGIYSLGLNGVDGRGNEWANVLHYKVVGSDATAAIDTGFRLINAWAASVQGGFLSCLASDVKLNYITSRRVSPAGQPTASTAELNAPGIRSGDSAVIAVGPMIAFYSDTGGPRVGKIFLPGIALPDLDEGVINVDLVTAINAFISLLALSLTLLPGTDLAELCILSRLSGVGYPVTTFVLRPKLGVQRRRLVPVR